MESCILRTDGKADKKIRDMFTSDQLTIALPHRVSLTLVRIGNVLIVESDLGMVSSECDLKRICEIDLNEATYPQSVRMDPDFMQAAKSYDCHSQTEKFVDNYTKEDMGRWMHAGFFGRDWLDQIYVHLSRNPNGSTRSNIEFSIFREEYEYIDDNEMVKFDEPAMTLVGSLRLNGLRPHYFMFVTWWGDDNWTYGRNFFFNNTKFPLVK